MKLQQIIFELQQWAPFSFQDSYDNSGLLIGSPQNEITKILVCLDVTLEVMQQATKGGFNLIISHHPIIFSGLKSITGKTMEEQVLITAIQNNIAIVALHTNLDNMISGVNAKLSQILGLQNPRILAPKKELLQKLVVFVPSAHLEKVQEALFKAGAGHIGHYDKCSFGSPGTGTFRAGENTQAFVGEKNKLHKEAEIRLEVVFTTNKQHKVISAMLKAHPYEEVAYDIIALQNAHEQVGAGMIGELKKETNELAFLEMLKQKVNHNVVRHTKLRQKPIKRVALCGGSGSFLIEIAKASGADIFITGDVKYHDFFKTDDQMIIADVGHYESEQFAKNLIHDFLIEKYADLHIQIAKETPIVQYY